MFSRNRSCCPGRGGRMTIDQIGFPGAGIMVQFCCRGADQQGGVPVDLHACFCGLDRRLKGLFPGTAAEVFQCDTHSVHLTRNRNRGCADDVAVLHNPGPGEEVRGHSFSGKRIILGVQSDGGPHTKVNRMDLPGRGVMDQHVSASADSAHPGFQHGNREGSGNRSVDGIASFRKHFCTGPGSQFVLGSNNPFGGYNGFFPGDQRFAEIMVHPSKFYSGFANSGTCFQ